MSASVQPRSPSLEISIHVTNELWEYPPVPPPTPILPTVRKTAMHPREKPPPLLPQPTFEGLSIDGDTCMNSKLKLAVCLSAALSSGSALAQEASSAAATRSVA